MLARARCMRSASQSSRRLGDRTGVAWSMNYQGDVARDQGDSAAARTLYEQAWRFFGNLGTAGELPARSLISEAWRENKGIIPPLSSLYRESIKTFPGTRPQTRNCSFAGVFRVFGRRSTRSRAFAAAGGGSGCAAPNILALRLHRRNKPNWKHILHPARQALTKTVGATAWLEGWALPIEKAIEEVAAKRCRESAVAEGAARAYSAVVGIDESAHGGDTIGRNADALGVFLNGGLVGSEVDAVHLVAGYVAMQPLNSRTHFPQDAD